MQRERKKERKPDRLLACFDLDRKRDSRVVGVSFLVEKRTASGVAEAAAKSKAA